ncbi:restriction endonuclease subunit S [Vibrio cholerae]|uniref:restriction endonuclease subunit S n=1 Tax=Vibrio cholerae TaxID=666 RepID=UPI001158C06B|nr:restriction endonuclease subunit S [Vibrio cholerae]EGR1055569.1 restriction endonuclease subunit S [Vibrio cholerae]TQQ40818.1 restriction endonuclease subunit S [Vibrio cholerae]
MVPNGWVEKPLKDICKKTISYGIVQTGENIENGIPCVRVVDLSKNTLNPNEMINTSEEIHQSYKKTILCEGELMMALRGEIGLVKKVTPELIGANITRGLARLSPIKSVDSDYLLWTLRSNKIKNELARKSGGSALQEIALGSLRKVVLPVPPLPEQRKIAKILSTWDKAITTTERLIATSQQQKKALMQQLLTGKKRLLDPETGKAFEGEWEEVKLGDVISLGRGFAFKSSQYADSGTKVVRVTNIASSGHIDLSDCVYVPNEITNEYQKYALKNEDILLVMVGATAGKLGFVSENILPSLLNQNMWSLRTRNLDKLNQLFLRHIAERIVARYMLTQQGSARGFFTQSTFELVNFQVPSVEEQQKIASVLTAADKEIELLEAKLAHLKEEKKALMQQLLTGKRRVKVDVMEMA